MNTQNDFLDNAVDDGVVTDGAGDLDAEMCSYIQNDTEEMCSSLRNDTCGDYCVDTKEKLVEVLYFRHFAKHFMFTSEGEKIRNKHLKNYFDVSVVVDIGCGNTNGK